MKIFSLKHVLAVCLIFLLGGLSCLLISGCSPSLGATDVSGSLGGAEVKIVTLDDGTKCAVLIGYQKGAISCDWK